MALNRLTAISARAKFVLHNFERGAISFETNNAPPCNKLQRTFAVQLSGPIDCQLYAAPWDETFLRGKQNAAARDVQSLSARFEVGLTAIQNAISNIALNRHPPGGPAFVVCCCVHL